MKNIIRYFTNIRYSTQIIFAASKKYFILKLILSIILSVFPYIPMLLWKDLINALTMFSTPTGDMLWVRITILVVIYCCLILVNQVFELCFDFVSFKYNDEINYYLDNLMVDKVSSVDLSFFDSSNLNDKLRNSWSLINSAQNLPWQVFGSFQSVVRLIFSLVLLIQLNVWIIPAVIILCIPSVLGDKKNIQLDYEFEKNCSNTYRKLEYYKSLFFERTRQELKLYRLKNFFSDLYKTHWELWSQAIHTVKKKQCLINCISLVAMTLTEVIVYIGSIIKLIAKEIGVGDVTYYISLLTQFRNDFTQFCYNASMMKLTSTELDDVRSFIELIPTVEKSGTLKPGKNPTVEFKNVFFKYPNSDHYVLENCSFTIHSGETVGLVGLNGSGKTTIVKLLLRFYEPSQGNILMDGIDYKMYDIVALRKTFGALFQDYVGYAFSVRENIALSDISKIDDNSKLWDACKKSCAANFIYEWENGINENLTKFFDKNGKELSGGQWQRIALARTFFRDAPIILLDEPSAALDPVAEHDIFKQFSELSKGKSAVLISHRLSSITLCDKILVLENGHIVEQGSHKALLAQNGRYAYLFNLQANKYM